ncbi:bifunctional [glutamine synthetase] adenylyltransferase/[glutamine synthetase]-adenylyl-L-tyrosine phosphorylase [Stakelama sp. CBK3Z-3]|uniref:Bifunctional [glutamine synthetase] adenylyltransferase/[glutamine synthetase]-adenylyl-L-tyrosine phosphorylase n=1 Tax=Stakelama flava TaxID=2860338 RepID=A0ABS6XHK7_9SPHN|nr:bifunctional [glutamine synthetase] adenylyltransferase/[glutamine synthetase]-adenylyl-L-tyrosine phosphorylase [Stakelama flava]MBW4329694.1 bifunctional [glutamine synthetase] adenylyltransferase/[glutamine synthetase]-adenylyl-L-tyrosine phosphorylase [Stakelama flava]
MESNEVAIDESLDRARRFSPFLAMTMNREEGLIADIESALSNPLSYSGIADSAVPVPKRMRIARRRLALVTAIGDLSGRYPLERVTGLLSDFADRALDLAIRTAITERVPDAQPCGFVGIALGKLGSRELNYSSDIDPILLYDPETLPVRPNEVIEDGAARIARRVVELLQARDGDGYVLRVDLRLRPSPEATPPALPVDAAISYYESQALPWERAAFIRARAAAGDIALGERFLDAIRPFVWRRSLDFGTIGEIRSISSRIRDHYDSVQKFGPGYDLKRGRGGIREIEFFAQVHQLIHGGRDPELRVPATMDALAALGGAGWIDAGEAEELAAAYRLLRTIEHRVQMIDDRQTHLLPERVEALDGVAALHGARSGEALLDTLRPHVAFVATLYDALEGEDDRALPADGDRLRERLEAAGFPDGESAARLIGKWRSDAYRALRTGAAKEAMEDALPGIVDALAASADPHSALLRLDKLLAGLPSAINFFRLLEAQPSLAGLLSAILCHAPTLADALGLRTSLLDGLIDASALDPVADVAGLVAEMRPRERGCDYERLLDHVRRVVGEKRFALGAQIIAGASDPLAVSAGYSRVAEAAIEVVAAATIAEFAQRHGHVPDSELVILALGRLGGGALTHASDLDLIFVFTGDHSAESDGKKPLGAVLYYNRLAQRITAALSVATAVGPLYEVDTRLRPSGAQGPISVSLTGFARYQREDAWTWEHMALTRARAVFGSDAARDAVQREIDAVLAGARPKRDIAREATKMRAEMAAHKPPLGPLDAKLLPGALVDLEFAVHVRQLRHRTGFDPHLGAAIDTLSGEGLLPPAMREAHDFLTRLLVTLRLVAPDAQPPAPASRALVARAVQADDWDAMVARFDATRQEVRDCWALVASPEGEE